ncbi:unnamed protein product, partial [Mesorhabditis spiculigera]
MEHLLLVLLGLVGPALAAASYIVPHSYDLTLQLPMNESYVAGSAMIHFSLLQNSQNITLHARGLHNFRNISLLSSNDTVEPRLKSLRILADTVEFNFATVLPRGKYLLTIGAYGAKIRNDSLGVFWRNSGELLATHFQPDFARTLMPCIDLPHSKAPLRLQIIHPAHTIAQSNTIANDVQVVDVDWQKTIFAPTPPLPAYLYTFSVMPDSFKQLYRATSFGVTLRVFHDPDVNGARILDAAVAAFELLASLFEVPLPLNKVDFLLVPRYVGGIENWGHIVVSEELAAPSTNDAHVAYVVAHELAHHWIGNKATVSSWKWACLQEDLTDYISYKVVRSLFGGDERYERFRLSKYVEVQLAEDFVSPNHSLELPEKIDNEMMTNHCYLKGVAYLESIEGLVGEGTIYQFWYRMGGFPEVLVVNGNKSTTVAQRGQKLWPLLLPNQLNLPQFMLTQAAEYENVSSPVIVNLNFTSFVRVNYDTNTWTTIFSQMKRGPGAFSAVGRAQLVSDFCHFHKEGLVPGGTKIKDQVLEMVYALPEYFELCDWNLYWCTVAPSESLAATLVKSVLVNFSALFQNDGHYGCKRGGAAKTINSFCQSFFGRNCV